MSESAYAIFRRFPLAARRVAASLAYDRYGLTTGPDGAMYCPLGACLKFMGLGDGTLMDRIPTSDRVAELLGYDPHHPLHEIVQREAREFIANYCYGSDLAVAMGVAGAENDEGEGHGTDGAGPGIDNAVAGA